MKPITLKAGEIKRILSTQLENKLSKDGFIYKKTDNEFRNRNGDYNYIFNIDQVSWSNSYSLHVRLYISQKQIESTIEKIVGKRRHKLTLGNDIGKIYQSPDGRKAVKGDMSIWIRQDEDLDSTVETLGMYYDKIARAYFERYKDLVAIDDTINNPPFAHCPAHVGGNFDERCMKGLIVARLIDRPNYEKLVEIYNEEIKETMNAQSIENYHKVREYLDYNKIN